MALKDWKRENHGEHIFEFYKDEEGKLDIFAYEIKRSKRWAMELNNSLKRKYFKSKSAALKFAKQYMRTH